MINSNVVSFASITRHAQTHQSDYNPLTANCQGKDGCHLSYISKELGWFRSIILRAFKLYGRTNSLLDTNTYTHIKKANLPHEEDRVIKICELFL